MRIISKVFRTIKSKYMDAKISSKIMLLFTIIMILTVGLSSMVYNGIYSKITLDKISDASVQSLDSIGSIISSNFSNENRYSKIIFTNNDIQYALIHAKDYNQINYTRRINIYLTSVLDKNSLASSVYIIDNCGNHYGADKHGLKAINIKNKNVTQIDWYQEAKSKNGSYILQYNGGGIFDIKTDENFVSMIRVIKNIQTLEQIGFLIVNIPESAIDNSYKAISTKYSTSVIVMDENGRKVSTSITPNMLDVEPELTQMKQSKINSELRNIKGRDYVISQLEIPDIKWHIVSAMPFDEFSKETRIFMIVTLGIILLTGLLLMFGAIFVSSLITYPIKKLLDSMKNVKKGEFNKVEITVGNDEVGQLKDRYNIMVEEIQNLFKKTINDQKLKRKAELNMLQAQIKPHFLYNTLDAISSLALSGQNSRVYFIVKSLGSFYRTSLSNGKEVITIDEEIKSVRNYLRIQKVRYGKMFKVKYDIDDRVLEYKTLKLILQPLVENSIYHGIRPKDENGIICISAKYFTEYIQLIIEDNGVGMKARKVEDLLTNTAEADNASFGLRGTLERLRIFYGINDICTIDSQENIGTKITITIPILEGDKAQWIAQL